MVNIWVECCVLNSVDSCVMFGFVRLWIVVLLVRMWWIRLSLWLRFDLLSVMFGLVFFNLLISCMNLVCNFGNVF